MATTGTTGVQLPDRTGPVSEKRLAGVGGLARAYIPFQEYTRRHSPEEGLRKGTIFPELYQPYRVGRNREGH
ncbi:MAG: spore coat associated protein CotJA [Moorellales bacterium]